MVHLRKVISGGQTGVDRAALQAAVDTGLDHGGWCPPGRSAADGTIPAGYRLKETPGERSEKAWHIPRSLRTEWNVRDSDGTLVLAPPRPVNDPGTEWTLRACKIYRKPVLVIRIDREDPLHAITAWLNANRIGALNIAGPSSASFPDMENKAYDLLARVFRELKSEVTRNRQSK